MTRYGLLLVLIAPFALAQENLAQQPAARDMFWQLLSEAGFGFGHHERAAFVVRTDDGGSRCIAWPSDGLLESARWEGDFPPGVVAIIHTHPNEVPMPSEIDANTARRTGIPVYVITRAQITRTTGGAPEVAVDGRWTAASMARPCSELTRPQLARLRERNASAADAIHLGSGVPGAAAAHE